MKKWLLFVVMFLAFLFIGCSSDQPNNSSNDNEIKEYVTVIFDSQSGSDVSSQKVEKGSKITKPADPTKEGYEFLGWYYDNQEWSFIGYVVTEDITLVAKWKQQESIKEFVTVTFDSDGGSSVSSQNIERGNKVTKPADPTKEGYEFLGWYYDNQEWSFIGYVVTEDITLVAKWKEKETKLKLIKEGDNYYLYLGEYPQTHVSDENLLKELNSLSKTNSKGYYEYNGNQYEKVYANPNKVGTFTDWAYGTTNVYEYSDHRELKKDTYEWFKVEPIKWRMVEGAFGTFFVSDLVLDRVVYDRYSTKDSTIYYDESTISKYLLEVFFNKAFSLKDQDKLFVENITYLENKKYGQITDTVTVGIADMVRILLETEIETYFNDDYDMASAPSDYSLAKGVGYNTSRNIKASGYWVIHDKSGTSLNGVSVGSYYRCVWWRVEACDPNDTWGNGLRPVISVRRECYSYTE